MATEPALKQRGGARSKDIRAARPYLLSLTPLRALARRSASVVALATLDVTGLAFGLYGALALRELYHGRTPLWGLLWEAPQEWLPFVVLVTLLVFWRAGLYAARDRRPGLGAVVSSLLVVGGVTVGFAIASGHSFDTYAYAPTAFFLSVLVIGLLRASYDSVTRDLIRLAHIRRRTVLVGDDEQVAELRRVLGWSRNGIEYEFVGESAPVPAAVTALLDAERVDELVLADPTLDEQQALELVDQAHRRGVRVRVAPRTTELLRDRGEYVPGQGVPLFELHPPVFAGTDWLVKRVFDLMLGSAVLVVGLPVWLLIAAAIRLDSPGPVLYRSRRVGLHEEEFGMFKFRTMHADAEARQAELENANEAAGPLFKIRSDPRVTRVGGVLRRFSLDEIPNLLNVLRGEMSLVGPRPLPTRDYELLDEWHRKRSLVLPGMTGLWQIAGRSDLSFDELVRLDFYYIERWSLWLDITILARTIPAVFGRRGAY
ncbi:MAG: sugar transferase [Thermoleophilia bacterium]|nr:sugar transferase [Thermoleophilia bacterium]